MLRLQGLGSNTPAGVPYTEDEIMANVRGGKLRGHIPDVGRVLPGQGTVIPPPSQGTHSVDNARLKKREKLLTKQVNMFMRLFRSDDKFSQMLTQLESQPKYGGGSGSGGCGMMSQEMMRTAARMRRRRTIVRDVGYPIRSFPFDFSRTTCRPGNLSPATSRSGFPGIFAGENGKCCSEWMPDDSVRDCL
nr:hypothetical protein [Tanacetum cinerariifolium]